METNKETKYNKLIVVLSVAIQAVVALAQALCQKQKRARKHLGFCKNAKRSVKRFYGLASGLFQGMFCKAMGGCDINEVRFQSRLAVRLGIPFVAIQMLVTAQARELTTSGNGFV